MQENLRILRLGTNSKLGLGLGVNDETVVNSQTIMFHVQTTRAL